MPFYSKDFKTKSKFAAKINTVQDQEFTNSPHLTSFCKKKMNWSQNII